MSRLQLLTVISLLRDADLSIPISVLVPLETKEDGQLSRVLNRTITFSSRSIEFLLQHRFDIQQTLAHGVPYLSRRELGLANERLLLLSSTSEIIDTERMEETGMRLYKCFRGIVQEWLATEPGIGDVLEIPESQGVNMQKNTILLINEMIEQDFPQCRCWQQRNRDATSITLLDRASVEQIRSRTREAKVAALAKCFGVSWIVEALIGIEGTAGYEDMARAAYTALNGPNVSHQPWSEQERTRWQTLLRMLQKPREKPPILLGHNVVYDIAILHSMFIGELPETLESFRSITRSLFPRLLDTKLLVSQTVDPGTVDESLQEIYQALNRQVYPFSAPKTKEWGFTRVGEKQVAARNAGFDSYMAAIVFLKLSCRRLRLHKRAEAEYRSGHAKRLSPMDQFVEGEAIQIPSFESDFFAPVRNKLRMSTAGILDLQVPVSPPSPACAETVRGGHRCHQARWRVDDGYANHPRRTKLVDAWLAVDRTNDTIHNFVNKIEGNVHILARGQ
ncbi:hypothetical protein RJ55_05237 [Drechmeria coniospora]|nr:hypothetical protein RJ55_05237 [Drechmeria coniospora]